MPGWTSTGREHHACSLHPAGLSTTRPFLLHSQASILRGRGYAPRALLLQGIPAARWPRSRSATHTRHRPQEDHAGAGESCWHLFAGAGCLSSSPPGSQVTVFPTYITLFAGYMGLLEGRSPAECLDKVQRFFLPTMAAGSVFWPGESKRRLLEIRRRC